MSAAAEATTKTKLRNIPVFNIFAPVLLRFTLHRRRLAADSAHSADRFKARGTDFSFANTGINDGLRLRRRVALESTRSTHRVTSPFPGSLSLKTIHIHRPADLPDVYAVIELDSRSYDAIFDVFPVLQPVPAELLDLRLLLACSGRFF